MPSWASNFICIGVLGGSSLQHRQERFKSLPEIIQMLENPPIFLTPRPHVDDEIIEYFSRVVRVPPSPALDEIQGYLEMGLG